MVHAALQVGLNGVAITDHNDVEPGLYAQNYAVENKLPIIVIPGCELTILHSGGIDSNENHLLALNVATQIPSYRSYGETIELIHSVGGLAVAPHPDSPGMLKKLPLDGFEWYNGCFGTFRHTDLPFAQLAGSDAHAPAELLRDSCYTLVEVDSPCIEAIVNAVRLRKTLPVAGKGFQHSLREY